MITREELNKNLDPNYKAVEELVKQEESKKIDEILDLAEKLQEECKQTADFVFEKAKDNSKMIYQDVVNVLIFKKLAEIILKQNYEKNLF